MTPLEREALYPAEVVDAWWWLDIYCRHYATLYVDQQAIAFLPHKDVPVAEKHLDTLRSAGLLEPGPFYRGNFVKKRL